MATKDQKAGASIPDLAKAYPISESSLYAAAKEGRLPGCRRLGKRYLVHLPTFEAWLAGGMGDEDGTGE